MPQPSAEQMRHAVRRGQALPAPGQDRPGRFPIRNRDDLAKAIRAVGRAGGGEDDRRMVRRFIMKRARQMGLEAMIPPAWNADGSLSS